MRDESALHRPCSQLQLHRATAARLAPDSPAIEMRPSSVMYTCHLLVMFSTWACMKKWKNTTENTSGAAALNPKLLHPRTRGPVVAEQTQPHTCSHALQCWTAKLQCTAAPW